MGAASTRQSNATGSLRSCQTCSFLNIFGKNETSVRPIIKCIDRFAIEPGKKNKCQRLIDLSWSICNNVAEPHCQPILVQSYSVIQAGKRKEFNSDFGKRRARTQLAVGLGEDEFKFCHANGTLLILFSSSLFSEQSSMPVWPALECP